MKFSREWLAQYVEVPEDGTELADALTGVGLNVESVEEGNGDFILDVEVTANRPDCMNHLGVAREAAAVLEKPLRIPASSLAPLVEPEKAPYVRVSVEDIEDCPRYVAVGVNKVQVGPSPDWLVRRLEAIGVRSINNIVDITNFVLWEYGQPLHAFDLEKLTEQRIVVRRARKSEQLTTLDGVDRELGEDVLVIADADKPVALAGIMGGLDSEVSETTTRVLIESAHFSRQLVRLAARRLDLHTDASHRFERGCDPEACLEAALRAAALMGELAGGEVEPVVVDARGGPTERPTGRLELDKLDRFSGVEVQREFVERGLAALGFELERTGDTAWKITVPSWRIFDFELDERGEVYPAYFYEEILRLRGFDVIPATIPEVHGPDSGSSGGHLARERLRAYAAAAGLAETVTYAFHSHEADAGFPGLERSGEPLVLANALSEQYEVMRRSLLPNLVSGAAFNQRRGSAAVRLFEIGHLFPGEEAEEVEAFGMVMGGSLGSPWERRRDLDLFDLKGAVEGLASDAGVDLDFQVAELPGFVAGTASEVAVGARRVGYLGQVARPDLIYPIYAAEIETAALARADVVKVRAPSRYPGVDMDLTLTHSRDTPWAEIERAVRDNKPDALFAFGLKDRYRGGKVPAGAVNTTLYFRYGADDRSLTQEEVNERHLRLAITLDERFGWRGEAVDG